MAIRPTGYTQAGVEVWHDEVGHGGVVPWDRVAFPRLPGDVLDETTVVLPCPAPGCGMVSFHPASGGSCPDAIPGLFARAYLASPEIEDADWAAAKARARRNSALRRAPGEPDRWRPEHDAEDDDGAAPTRVRERDGSVRVRQRPLPVRGKE